MDSFNSNLGQQAQLSIGNNALATHEDNPSLSQEGNANNRTQTHALKNPISAMISGLTLFEQACSKLENTSFEKFQSVQNGEMQAECEVKMNLELTYTSSVSRTESGSMKVEHSNVSVKADTPMLAMALKKI